MVAIALYQPDIPQNAGNILRLAACLGVTTHVIGPPASTSRDRALRRAGMDYLAHVDIVRHVDWTGFCRLAGGARTAAWSFSPRAARPLIPISPSPQTTSSCSAAKAPACPRRCTPPPTPGSSSRCGRACVRSMSPAPRPWYWARRCGRPTDFRTGRGTEMMDGAPPGLPEDLEEKKTGQAPGSPSFATGSPPPSRRSRTTCRRHALRRPAGRPLRPHAVEAQGPRWRRRRRRRHGDHARPRLREGRRPRLDRPRRVLARIPQGDSRRRGRPGLLGERHLADRPPAQPERPGRPHEHPHGGHQPPVVRRRRRPDPGARPPPHPGRPGFEGLPRGDEGRLRRARRAPATSASRPGATSISSSSTATSRAASAASSTTG